MTYFSTPAQQLLRLVVHRTLGNVLGVEAIFPGALQEGGEDVAEVEKVLSF